MAHIIVLGNEKGGSGKSTTAMHIATALARAGFVTGALDLDLRQLSFGRYLSNRQNMIDAQGFDIACPIPISLVKLDRTDLAEGDNMVDRRVLDTLAEEQARCDFIVIDCPGSHTRYSAVAHMMADTLVTPMNDSFVDFDLLARIDPQTGAVTGPSVYSEMVWSARQERAQRGLKPTDWLVIRNRLGSTEMHNKRKVGAALEELANRIGFRVAPGFSERVIFRELFPTGMTLLDLRDLGVERLNMSNLAARQELRDLMSAMNLPGVSVSF